MLAISVVSDSLGPHVLETLAPQNSPGKNTGVGSQFLLQGIFQTQVFSIGGRFVTGWATREAQEAVNRLANPLLKTQERNWIKLPRTTMSGLWKSTKGTQQIIENLPEPYVRKVESIPFVPRTPPILFPPAGEQ